MSFPMETEHVHSAYDFVETDELCSVDPKKVWIENALDKNTSFIGVVQGYRAKTATTVKANVGVAYKVFMVLMEFERSFVVIFSILIKHW